jgi:predicted Zn finger-like uncharacterized protein
MDVRCSRCGTEYDFDDALVSERGTTVKCTNCAHQFKVYPGGSGGVPERWIVRKGSGRELVYTSLRDLQRAIAQRQVGPTDLLSRGGGHPLRALGSIAELEPFFTAQGPELPAPAAPAAVQRTLLGISPKAGQLAEDTIPDQSPFAETFASPQQGRQAAPVATPIGGLVAPRAPLPAPAPPPPRSRGAAPSAPYGRTMEAEPKTLPRNAAPEALIPTEPPARASLHSTLSSHGAAIEPDPPTHPSRDGVSGAFRAYQESFGDESLPQAPPPARGSALRWVVGLVVLGGLAFVGGTVGVKYLKGLRVAPAPSAPVADDRVHKLLEQAVADLSREDFESAKEQLDKASALAEHDPAVLSALARLEATRADVRWLGLKLVDPSHTSELDAERAELQQRLARVRKAADAASAVSPNDTAVLRARVDALRLEGNVSGARALVGSLGADASDPDTAYVLAALDLAEATPAWPTVLDRLRTAASAERGVGRARAALVYALAASGATADARAELAKLDSSGSPSALTGRLRGYVDRLAATAPSASATPPAPPASASSAPPPPPAPPAGGVAAGAAPAGDSVPRGLDFRHLLEAGSAAKASGDLGRAEALYRAAEEQQPGNAEALGGLGDVARLRGDSAAAVRYYDAVLRQNPTYLPTLIASADLKWASGDRPGALALYKRVTNQSDPGSPYGQRAAARLAEAQGGGSAAGSPAATREPPHAAATKPAAEPTPPSRPPSDTPNVDTSDLPGFK